MAARAVKHVLAIVVSAVLPLSASNALMVHCCSIQAHWFVNYVQILYNIAWVAQIKLFVFNASFHPQLASFQLEYA